MSTHQRIRRPLSQAIRFTVLTEWHPYYSGKVTRLDDDTFDNGMLMRRRVGAAIEYRPPTEAEQAELYEDQAFRF